MKKLNLFQKLYLDELIGEVIEREEDYVRDSGKKVTHYTISTGDKNNNLEAYFGVFGHNKDIQVGDNLKVQYFKYFLADSRPAYSKKEGGIVFDLWREWKEIKKYSILKD